MGDTVIKIENLAKRYVLGQIGIGTLRDDISRQWARLRGMDDPFAAIDDSVVKSSHSNDVFWALRDVNLEVQRGEVLGLLGANGAGKSTLLKLISQITMPTQGRIRAKGRIASLLEVGTGFHEELTGRENIFMNGAIMGMKRGEITKQIDNIIEFSGCGPHIDTPVKRYSSGMFVRLGFAVAAHLQCEILIVDEVLAVGDRNFQERCIKKMREMTLEGDKTIIFVSHDLSAVKSLCKSGAIISNGRAEKFESISDAINNYVNTTTNTRSAVHFPRNDSKPSILSLSVDEARAAQGDIVVTFTFESSVPFRPHPGITISTRDMRPVVGTNGTMHVVEGNKNDVSCGEFQCCFEQIPLHEGVYYISVWLGNESKDFDEKYAALSFHFQPTSMISSKPPVDVIGPLNFVPSWTLN